MFDIEGQLKKLTINPGVYLMKDKYQNVIYIGKAKNLKKRVISYFRKSNSHNKKTRELISKIEEFEYIITDSEVEALILEASMIRKYQPQYNILLRDDKQYPYIKITIDEQYPRVFKVFKVKKDKAKYYGPYVSGDYMQRILNLISEYYPLRTCNKIPGAGRNRACLNYDIKKCLGPCFYDVNEKFYKSMINDIINLLDGHVTNTVKMLNHKMITYSEKLEFEKAAKARDTIIALEKLQKTQKLYTLDESNKDVIAFSKKGNDICFMVFFIRNGKLLGREHYILNNIEEENDSIIMEKFLERFYSNAMIIPKEIIISKSIINKELIEEWLKSKISKKIEIITPKIGDKVKLIKLVEKNAKEYIDKFSEKIDSDNMRLEEIKNNFKTLFNIELKKVRIEAYDISNIFGAFSVGSMIVFERGVKKKSDYRKFNIKTIEGPNDYGSMMEVLYRRFKRGIEERKDIIKLENKFDIFPEILLIDGGLQHASVVEDVIKSLNLNIPVIGMVKDNKHKTKGLVYNGIEVNISKYKELYKFIYSVQEEVHRFAIEHHKTLRLKAMTKSILDDIPGVGKKRRENLLLYFKSIEKIRNASLKELNEVDGINEKIAQEVFNYFYNL